MLRRGDAGLRCGAAGRCGEFGGRQVTDGGGRGGRRQRREEVGVVGGVPLDDLAVEQVCVVLPDEAEPPRPRPGVPRQGYDTEVELGRAVRDTLDRGERDARQIEVGGGPVVAAEVHVEDRVPARVARRRHGGDDLPHRDVEVLVGVHHRLVNPAEEMREVPARVEVHDERDVVDEHADHTGGLGRVAVGHGGPDAEPGPAGARVQQQAERGERHREHRNPAIPGVLHDAVADHVLDVPPERRARERPLGGPLPRFG